MTRITKHRRKHVSPAPAAGLLTLPIVNPLLDIDADGLLILTWEDPSLSHLHVTLSLRGPDNIDNVIAYDTAFADELLYTATNYQVPEPDSTYWAYITADGYTPLLVGPTTLDPLPPPALTDDGSTPLSDDGATRLTP